MHATEIDYQNTIHIAEQAMSMGQHDEALVALNMIGSKFPEDDLHHFYLMGMSSAQRLSIASDFMPSVSDAVKLSQASVSIDMDVSGPIVELLNGFFVGLIKNVEQGQPVLDSNLIIQGNSI